MKRLKAQVREGLFSGFAEVCKIERASYMGMIERGETNISVRTALRIAKGLGMTLASLFEELERDR